MWFLIIFIIGVVIFFYLRDRDKMLSTQVDQAGGMKQKYNQLSDWLLSDPQAKITRQTRDHIQISNIGTTTSTHFLITQAFGQVEVEWISNLGVLGKHQNKWRFKEGTSESEMIETIGTYLNEYQTKIFG